MMRRTESRISRRCFVATAAAAWLALRTAPAWAQERNSVGLLVPSDAPPALRDPLLRGAQLGAEEAGHTAGLLGRDLELTIARPDSRTQLREEATRLLDGGAFALVGGLDAEDVAVLTDVAAGRALVVNVACADDRLRGEACAPHLFHVAASDAMRRAALAGSDGATRVVHWHPSLHRFGAAQLTARYAERFGDAMTDAAWTGWFALKVLGESMLRTRSLAATELVAHLETPRTRFDGHKGSPLSFRASDHQLRQLLYLQDAAGQLAGERPVIARGEDAAAALDRFGTAPATAGTCAVGATAQSKESG
jgi:ABC-type branched-subunit amino acid transport system substrate-binding protein